MIEFINLSKKYKNNFWEKDFFALNDVSFEIKEGDLVGFLGANGAGKTTLIKCLLDFTRPSSGEIVFDQSKMGRTPDDIKSNIGYLPERAYLYQHLSGREFLEYVGALNNLKGSELRELIKKWSSRIEIEYALDKRVRSYSKGMQQRLGFVASLIHNPKFLVLDEPLSGLDPIGRRDFKKVLKELHTQGTTIFFSSHIVSDVEEICSKVVCLEKGRLIYTGTIENLMMSNNSLAQYQLTYIRPGSELREVMVLDDSTKDLELKKILEAGFNILSLEREKVSLEEIVYKIKK